MLDHDATGVHAADGGAGEAVYSWDARGGRLGRSAGERAGDAIEDTDSHARSAALQLIGGEVTLFRCALRDALED